jgi:hypothetical protein
MVASLALARRGPVLLEAARTPVGTGRIDSLPLPLLALLIELGVHPTAIGAEVTIRAVLSSWESEQPEVREVAPRVHIDRVRLESELQTLVERHPRIELVHKPALARGEIIRVDATGRRSQSADAVIEPPSPWFAKTVLLPGRYSEAQQGLRLAPFAGGYFYRLATPDVATVGAVTPELPTGDSARMEVAIREQGCSWILAGLAPLTEALPGRGGKTSVQRSVPSLGWRPVGDAAFASDSLSSQGLANGLSSAMKLATPARITPLEAYRAHVLNVVEVIDRCRHAGSESWQNYRAFLVQEVAAIFARKLLPAERSGKPVCRLTSGPL